MKALGIESSFASLHAITEAFRSRGCAELLVKILAKNQDNEKNQIYLGKSLSLSSYLPGRVRLRLASNSSTKPRSNPGSPIVALELDFGWLWPGEKPSPAPRASIIEYSQYPEVRFSGFLAGTNHGPDALRRERQDEYGGRALILGVADEHIFGAVVTEAAEPRAFREVSALQEWDLDPLLKSLNLEPSRSETVVDKDSLLEELRALAGKAHHPQRLRKSGGPVEFVKGGRQAGGWTLEALLGIPMNSKSEPDKFGFEIKAVGGSRVSLITTEPDFGFRAEQGVSEYLLRFGRPAQTGEGKLVFSGIHRCGQKNSSSGAHLSIENWDFMEGRPNGQGQPNVVLLDTNTDEVISGWSFEKLGASWSKKHAGAIFVEATQVRASNGEIEGYRFGPASILGLGTSALRLVSAIGRGEVFLDPGDTMASGAKPHARTQWRISGNITTNLPLRLGPLYNQLTEESLHPPSRS